MNKLDFVCVGAQKSGTTALDGILRYQVSDVVLPCIKETKFFHDDYRDQYKRGLSYYWSEYFPDSDGGGVFGEIDPEYLFFSECAGRLYQANPEMKIVVMLREPIQRAISHYQMSVFRGYEGLDFSTAVRKEKDRMTLGEKQINHFSYYSRSNYIPQLNRYIQFFGKENIKIIISEEFKKNDVLVVNEILEHIGSKRRLDGILFNKSSANSAKESRWPFLNRIINSNSKIKSAAGVLIDEKKRVAVKKMIMSINSVPITSEKVEVEVDEEVGADFLSLKKNVLEYLKDEFSIDATKFW